MSNSIRAPLAPPAGTVVPALLLLTCTAVAAPSQTAHPPDEVIVTAVRMEAPLILETDPRTPRQPVPAHDGADYLKTIPGFSVIRKGGTDGDPVFRGMAASRVNILLDGEQVLGGCGNRMDPPTAYVFPEAYDRIRIVKGPQTVVYGPGNSAATVLFDRSIAPFASPGYEGRAAVLGGSPGRADVMGDLRLGTPGMYGQLTGTRAESDDYDDGDGRTVHSAYMRWSANAALGWTPDPATLLELSGASSDGEAAYADRAMDGVKFARENIGVRFMRQDLTRHIGRVQAQVYYNYVDHVMDNYSLRAFAPSPAMPGRAVSNPDRRTTGGRASLEWLGPSEITGILGLDTQENRHRLRSTMNETVVPFESLARIEDARFRDTGVYAEMTVPLRGQRRIVSGVRADRWEARDERSMLRLGMTNVLNPTAGRRRDATLVSGFGRFEYELRDVPATLFAGLGHVQRFPDYWELFAAGRESETALSAFFTQPEKTTQLDVGLVYRSERLAFSFSGFASDVSDYVLIQSGYAKGMRRASIARNIDAKTVGGEADAAFALSREWKLTGTLAYTYGENDTDAVPLAQMPPLELRAGLEYGNVRWSAGLLARAVAAQGRVALNQGNIVGQDLGPTSGFAVISLNGGWRPTGYAQVTFGIDNLFDRAYAEHLSRGGSPVSGFEQTSRVNEPGRTLWIRLAAQLR